jgi:RNA polymerase sigma factor (sigma-70 family)
MSDGPWSGFLRHLGATLPGDGAPSDERLLERFLRDRDAPAFEALVRRHGPMVLGVCRRILRDAHDAEDAFQATFLALVRKADTIAPRELLGHWLFGVAYRTALYTRRTVCRRRAVEKQVEQMPERGVVEPESVTDLRAFLDRELSRLPAVYRIPVVLCELEGKTRQEVARQLGVPEGTVSSRLARGRELLRKRLVRQGVALTSAALAQAFAQAASAAPVPAALLRATVQAGVLVATGRAAAVSAPVACLLRAVLRQRVVAKLRTTLLVLLAVGLFGLAAGLVARQFWPQASADSPQAAAPVPRPVERPRPPAVVRFAGMDRTRGPDPTELVDVNGTLFFAADDGIHGRQLWKIARTPNGPAPVSVTNIRRGAVGLNPQYLTNVNGTLFFVPDGPEGRELWKSDGTAAGTVRLKEFHPAGNLAFPPPGNKPLIAVGRLLFFVASDGDHNCALWKSDGTAAGTVLVKHIFAVDALTFPRRMADVNGTLFFVADDGVHGPELWKSDGTEAGTVLVKDICPGRGGAAPLFLTNVNGTLFFTAREPGHGRELWRSDGTEAGTVLVKDINPGPNGAFPDFRQFGNQIGNLTAVGRTLFFAADDGVHGRKLWKSDGTRAGTVLVKDVSPGSDWQLQVGPDTALASVNGTLYFMADDGMLWRSDGTRAGTAPLKRIIPNPTKDSYASLTNGNGTLFVVVPDYVRIHGARAVNRVDLWRSDSTTAGTVRVQEINPGRAAGLSVRYVGSLTTVGDALFFATGQPRKTHLEKWHAELWHLPAPRRQGD